jgi:hypothetical protein
MTLLIMRPLQARVVFIELTSRDDAKMYGHIYQNG